MTWISSGWLSILERIVQDATLCEHPLEVIDVTSFVYPRYSLGLASLSQQLDLEKAIKSQKWTPKLGQPIWRRQSHHFLWLDESTRSELRTKYRGETPRHLTRIERLETRVIQKLSLDLFSQCLAKNRIDNEVWLYPNGRYAVQRSILEASRTLGVESVCYERSRFPTKAFIRKYRVHDRVQSQNDYFSNIEKVQQSSLNSVSQWLQERMDPHSVSNPFSSRFIRAALESTFPSGNYVTFFSSSRDELEGLGDQWGHFGWSSQYEAYSELGTFFRKQGLRTVLRLHPNLANKSSVDLRTELVEINKLEAEGFEIIGPYSSVNSYALAKNSKAIIVSRSTIGIEAMAMGVPTIATSNAFFDQLPCLITVRDAASLVGLWSKIEEVDREALKLCGLQWLAFSFQRDWQLNSTYRVKPTLRQSLGNLVHPDVQIYYACSFLIRILTFTSRKKYLKILGKF